MKKICLSREMIAIVTMTIHKRSKGSQAIQNVKDFEKASSQKASRASSYS